MKKWKGKETDTLVCFHCGCEFKSSRPKNLGEITLCTCKSSSPNAVDLNRFLSAFHEETARALFNELSKSKTKKWKPHSLDTSSLKAHIERYGVTQGKLKFQEKQKKTNTLSIDYFLKQGYDMAEAVRLLKKRQGVGALERFVFTYGIDLGVKKWQERNKKWSEKMHSLKVLKESFIPPELQKERDRKLQYAYCAGILTDLAKRMFYEQISESENSKREPRHLDHQFSKSAAFLQRCDIKIISSPVNLKWLSKSENLAKKDICAKTYKEICEEYKTWILNDNAKHYDDICNALLNNWRRDGLQV